MAQAVMEAVIRAYDQFSKDFAKFDAVIKSSGQSQQQLTAATQTVNQAMTQMHSTQTRVMQATDSFNRALTTLVQGEKHGTSATAEFEQAFTELTAAQRELEQQTQSLNAALTEHGVTGESARAVVREMERAFVGLGQGGDVAKLGLHGAGGAASGLLTTLGQIGVLYMFRRALQDIINVGRDFELSIRQAQAVTGEMTSALSKYALAAANSIQGPRQMAQAYYELGAAGLTAHEVLIATPAILDFATAGITSLDRAAYATISTVKSFGISWEDVTTITDAFTQAMNAGTLAADDFQWVMSSAGAVAKMANQDFRQVVGAASALKDAGIQAQDGATSIKAALLQLINPSTEAQRVMEDLGLEIYNSSGQMKQWSDIIAEFERVLAPYNEQSRNWIMSTIAGTDGIRALAASLNVGSETLAAYVAEMEMADGATEGMADLMANTFDGALRKVNGNLERTKILIFDDWDRTGVGMLTILDDIVVGFNSMDSSLRMFLTLVLGVGGVLIGLNALQKAYSAFILETTAASAAAKAFVGALNPLLLVVPAVAGVVIGLYGAQQKFRLEQEKTATSTQTQLQKLEQLQARYSELSSQTERTTEDEDELRKVTEQIARIIPDAVTGTDNLGYAMLDSEIAAGRLKEKIDELKTSLAEYYALLATEAEGNLKTYASSGRTIDSRIAELERHRDTAPESISDMLHAPGDPDVAPSQLPNVLTKAQIEREIQNLRAMKLELDQKTEDAQRAIQIRDQINAGNWGFLNPETTTSSTVTGGKTYNGKTGGAGGLDSAFEASRKWIEYKKSLNQMSAEDEIAAWAQVAARYKEGTEERMQADVALHRAKERLLDDEARAWGDVYQQSLQLMKHESTMGRMSVDEQIAHLERLRSVHGWTYQQMWEIEENLYRLRRQQLSTYLGSLETEYRGMLDTLDADTERSLSRIQAQLDALDREETAQTREEEERKHVERLAELQEQRRYHSLRTGSEHAKALTELDKQIAEEQRQWELKQENWSRADQRDALRQKQTDIRDAAAKERGELEEHYRRAREIAESGILDTVAALSATKPEWFDTGKELIDQLIAGLESGDFSGVTSRVNQVRSQAAFEYAASSGGSSYSSDSPSGSELLATITSGQYQMVGNTAAMSSRELANILGKGVTWDQSSGRVVIGGQSFNPLSNVGGQTSVGIRQVAESLGYGVNFDPVSGTIKIHKAGEGALFTEPALSMIAEAGESELAMPLSKFQPMMDLAMGAAFRQQMPADQINQAADRIVKAIEERLNIQFDKLINIEHFEPEDETDVRIFARELMSLVNQSRLIRGE